MNLILAIAVLSFVSSVYTYSTFCPRNGEQCMHFKQCTQEIRDNIKAVKYNPHVRKQLMEARCDEPNLHKLCCKPQIECYTWDGRPGECVDWKKSYRNMTLRQARISRCSKKKGTLCYSNAPVIQNSDCEASAFPTDPSYGCCGRDALWEQKLIGGIWKSLLDYPYLAVLKYEADKKNCTGVLISGKYVLTSASCVHPYKDKTSSKPYAVVLGEYDKSTLFDCDLFECRTTAVEETIGIEEIIMHEGFNPFDLQVKDDIALIRLIKMANFSDSIKPICLPILPRDVIRNFTENSRLWSIGWGDIFEDHRPSDVIRQVGLPFVDPLTCVNTYKTLTSHQMCAGGESNQSPCMFDYGSPLMYQSQGPMEVLGIASYHDHNICNGSPGVYTKVFPYLSWIHRHVRP